MGYLPPPPPLSFKEFARRTAVIEDRRKVNEANIKAINEWLEGLIDDHELKNKIQPEVDG